MKTKTILNDSPLAFTFLLSFFCLGLSAQNLPNFGVKLQKGDVYFLDYQVGKSYSSSLAFNKSHPTDTNALVKRLIRIEVIEKLPNEEYLLALASERSVRRLRYGIKMNAVDDTYLEPSWDRHPAQKTHEFSFGQLVAHPLVKNTGIRQNPQFTHLKVDANLMVLKVFQNEEDARLDKGRAPTQAVHLWLDFDIIGIWLQADQLELRPYITPIWRNKVPALDYSTEYIKKYAANYIDAFAVDIKSGWLHFAQLKDEKDAKPGMTIYKTIKGWKGEARKQTIVHGYLSNTQGGLLRKENLTELVPFYFDKGRENITISPDGYFRWETYLDHPAYFSLRDLQGDGLQKIYGYVQPGDELYLEANFKRLDKIEFKGKNKAANQFLNQNGGLPLPGLTEWLGQVTIPYSKWEQEDVNQVVIEVRETSLMRLKKNKAILDPRFYQDEFWRLQYSLARFIKPTRERGGSTPRNNFLPILNLQAEHLPIYWSYIEQFNRRQVQDNQFNSISQTNLSFRERYNSSKLFLSGFPQHIVMYHALREALHHKKVAREHITHMKGEFLSLCRDEKLTADIRTLSKRLEYTAAGNYFLNLQLLDTLGNAVEMKDFKGKKVVVEPIFRLSAGHGPKSYKKWREKHPDIVFIRLALFEQPDNLASLKARIIRNTSLDVPIYFPQTPEEKTKAYRFLAIDSLHLNSSYPHLFFLDEKGKIIKQEYFSFDDNLAAFAQLPSAIIPLWKNPIWKVAIPLSLLFGLLTWLSLRIIGRIREKNLERQRQMVEMELNSIRSQLNPHFVYNTMSSIQNLILSDRSSQASQYLAELAGLMRAVLNQTKKGIISLEEELSTIRQYCKLEALRKSFAWNIKVDKSVDLHNTDIPALLLQPYVENAIIHGLRGNEVDGKIDLTISQKHGSLDIIIQDNGVGIAENLHRSMGGNQLGLHLNRKRLELLYGKLAKVIIQDLNQLKKGKKGTQVSINIPI